MSEAVGWRSSAGYQHRPSVEVANGQKKVIDVGLRITPSPTSVSEGGLEPPCPVKGTSTSS